MNRHKTIARLKNFNQPFSKRKLSNKTLKQRNFKFHASKNGASTSVFYKLWRLNLVPNYNYRESQHPLTLLLLSCIPVLIFSLSGIYFLYKLGLSGCNYDSLLELLIIDSLSSWDELKTHLGKAEIL